MELETIILSEVIQTLCVFSHFGVRFGSSDMCVSYEIITEVRKLVRGQAGRGFQLR